MLKENKEKKEKKETKETINFRIVKERWYHRMLDKFIFYPWSHSAASYYSVHIEANIMRRKGKWFLIHPKKITIPKPEENYGKEWTTKASNPGYETYYDNIFDEKNTITGFEMDTSEVGESEKSERLEDSKSTQECVENPTYDQTQSPSKEISKIEKLEYVPEEITCLDDIPSEILLQMLGDPQMAPIITKVATLDEMEKMANCLLGQIQQNKKEQEEKEEKEENKDQKT